MRPGRVVALVVGIVMLLPSLGLLFGGLALGAGYQLWRDGDGFIDLGSTRLATETAAIVAGDADFDLDPGPPAWIWSMLDTDLRVRADSVTGDESVFIGVADSRDVARYLDDVAHDVLVEVVGSRRVIYRSIEGDGPAAPPTAQPFWAVSASGAGEQEFRWDVESGNWSAVLMNADGAEGVIADVELGVRSGAVLPIVVVMLAIGVLMTAGSVALIVYGAAGARDRSPAEAVTSPVDHDPGDIEHT